MNDIAISIYDMNAVKKWENEMSVGLSNDENIAMNQINEKINKMGGKVALSKQINDIYQPLTRATQLGLMEYPSVVINERYVVYGTDDYRLALTRYVKWIKERKE